MIWAECLWSQRSEFDGDAFSVLIASATTEAVLRLKWQIQDHWYGGGDAWKPRYQRESVAYNVAL